MNGISFHANNDKMGWLVFIEGGSRVARHKTDEWMMHWAWRFGFLGLSLGHIRWEIRKRNKSFAFDYVGCCEVILFK